MTRYTIQKAPGRGWWVLRWELLENDAASPWGRCTIIGHRHRHRSSAALAATDCAATEA